MNIRFRFVPEREARGRPCAAPPASVTPSPPIGWLSLRAALLVLLLGVYVASFWGVFDASWPSAVHRYSGWIVGWCWDTCRPYVRPGPHTVAPLLLVWAGVSWIMGVLVPLVVAAVFSRWPGELGLRLPNRWGWRMVWVSLGVVVPVALLLAREQSSVSARPSAPSYCVLILAVTVAEHILMTGVFLAVLLPGGCIPRRTAPAAPTGSSWHRVVGWLGLAQPAEPHACLLARFLGWWGLDLPGLIALVGVGLLFGLIHVGTHGPIEFLTSFPGGFALGYLTLRSGSIWPGWLIHCVQMALVLVLRVVPG